MRASFMIARTVFVEGREDDYNDWYTWVHLWDVMRLGVGVVAAQRFRRSDRQVQPEAESHYPFPYLCIYEVTEPAAMTLAHAKVFTDEMPISDAYSLERASEVYFDEIVGFTRTPGEHPRAEVIVESIDRKACDDAVEREYRDQRFAALADLPGVVAGSFGRSSGHQMFKQAPMPGLCAVYWTTDPNETVDAWIPPDAAPLPSLDPKAVSIDGYSPIMERLTMLEVRSPSDGDRRTAQEKRDALGKRVHVWPPKAD